MFWVLLVAGSIALVQYTTNRPLNAPEISYNRFAQELERDNIAALEITDRGRVRGRVKNPVILGTRTIDHFTLMLPFAPTEAWVTSLVAKGIDVRASEEHESIGVFLFSFLPYLLIFGLLVFMLRRKRKA